MAEPDRKLFRAEAMKHLSSPDNLEQLMPVAGAKDWLLMATALVLLGLFGVWCVAGRVPTVVNGRGVIVRSSEQNDGLISVSWYAVKDGRQIKPGMRVQITPDIYGTVTSVIYRTATSVSGGNGDNIEVRARLERDGATPIGLTYSSRVTVESRAPVTYFLPILRKASGVD
jgi:hypothetical protein